MSDQSNASAAEVQSKLQHLNSLLLDMLLPAEKVAAICREIDFAFRDRAYTPMVTVWMFITQVLSADHSCQQAVARLNGWRTAQGLSHCSSETTSYCKARGRLPEALFERLLAWTALQCHEATVDKWLFHGREVDIVGGPISPSLVGGTAPSQFEKSDANGSLALQDSGDGSQGVALPLDRLQSGTRCHVGRGAEIRTVPIPAKLHRRDAGPGRIRGHAATRLGKTVNAVGQLANNHPRTESRQPPKPQRTPPDQTPPEVL